MRILALRDEVAGREFDDPATWWPHQSTVVGGRDHTAGGSWAVTDISTGVTALVLNRPERRVAGPGAPSRGVLPLLAVDRGASWPDHLDVQEMASFNVVLAAPDVLTMWVFDGQTLTRTDLAEGTHMITSGGVEDGKADRYLKAFTHHDGWLELVQAAPPADDLTALVVRHEAEGQIFATVFGQLITARPGAVSLSYSRTPWLPGTWTEGLAAEEEG